MSDTIIKLENISKQYRLGQVGTQTLRGDFQRWWHTLRGKEDPTLKIGASNKLDSVEGEYVWALRDINLEVKQGEVLGIIGKNGAGKSTLLKLLSRVTGPTTGQIKVKGRIASLLEVGTGFHPELTGRENIFLNGAILGMTKAEIKGKFDEIVDFAGVAKYIDTPVKRYSSGMYVRLAFAVAAHLEPDILVVDEVLAVGDAEFQKKAIGKMQDISSGGGRTVLFVSHNMVAVKNLCKSSILIDEGRIINFDSTDKIISHYLQNKSRLGDQWILTEISSTSVYYTKISCALQENNYILILNVELLSIKEHKPAFVAINISNSLGDIIMQAIPFYEPFIHFELNKEHKLKITINMPPLIPGEYHCDAWIGSNYTETIDYKRNVVSFKILKAPSQRRTFPYSSNHGYIVPHSECIFQ